MLQLLEHSSHELSRFPIDEHVLIFYKFSRKALRCKIRWNLTANFMENMPRKKIFPIKLYVKFDPKFTLQANCIWNLTGKKNSPLMSPIISLKSLFLVKFDMKFDIKFDAKYFFQGLFPIIFPVKFQQILPKRAFVILIVSLFFLFFFCHKYGLKWFSEGNMQPKWEKWCNDG